jgi:hypothetical protein
MNLTQVSRCFMWKATILMFISLLPMSASAQRVSCDVFTPETVAKMNSHHIDPELYLSEYMTASDLSAAMNRAAHCEFPPEQALHDLDAVIGGRVYMFAETSEQLKSMFIEFCASAGQNSITSDIALKWLRHNNLVSRFNSWDAAYIRHNWAGRTP